MADLVYLSIWLRDYHASNMLKHWKRVIDSFPASLISPGIRSLTIYPFHWGETPVFERNFGEGTPADDVMNLAAEFLHEDYAYEVELSWDLWLPNPSQDSREWVHAPSTVSVACMGAEFDHPDSEEGRQPEATGELRDDMPRDDIDDRANIQINFGLDTPFLPPEEDVFPELDPDFDPDLTDLQIQKNLQQLIGFVHVLDQKLPVIKRVLWCESGENLAEKILEAWNMRL